MALPPSAAVRLPPPSEPSEARDRGIMILIAQVGSSRLRRCLPVPRMSGVSGRDVTAIGSDM